MRMMKRLCQDEEKMNHFLLEAQTGYLGLSTQNSPYVVPLNYVWHEGNVYFHGASEGRKMDIIRENKDATFVVCENYGTMADLIPAETDTAYFSVMLFGKVEIVQDLSESTSAMQNLLNKYVPGYYHTPLSKHHVEKYQSSLGSKTVVFKLVPSNITAKENEMLETKEFYVGRDVTIDSKK